jgi:hypothetical protein
VKILILLKVFSTQQVTCQRATNETFSMGSLVSYCDAASFSVLGCI